MFFESVEKSYKNHLKWVPGGSWGLFFGLLGAAFDHFNDQRPPRRKKRRKLTWRTLAPGSKLGLKIFIFAEKALPDMNKWVPRQALEK